MTSIETVRKANLVRVVYIGICFMMLFSAYFAGQNLMTQIYKQLGFTNLGQICFLTIVTFFALASTVSTHFYKKIPTKYGLLFSSMAYVGFLCGGTLSTYCDKYKSDTSICSATFIYGFSILTSAILGCASAFLWLCQATYVNACADEETRGTYNGIFLSLMQTSQILSGVIATFVLGYTDQFTFYAILLVLGSIAVSMFLFIQNPVKQEEEVSQATTQQPQETLEKALNNFYSALKDQKNYYLFMAILFCGMATWFYAINLGVAVTTTVDSDNVNVINQSTGFVFIVLAIGEILAGITVGRLADRYDKIKLLSVTMFINEAALVCTLLACLAKSYTLMILCGALWGFGDTSMGTMISVIIGSKFNASPVIFSAYRFFSSSGGLLIAVCSMVIPSETPYMFMIIIAGALLTTQTMFYKYLGRETRKSSDYLRLEDNEKKLMFELKNIV